MSKPCIAVFYGGPEDGKEMQRRETEYWIEFPVLPGIPGVVHGGDEKIQTQVARYKLDPAPFDTIYDVWEAQGKDAKGIVRSLRYNYIDTVTPL